jgi:ParB family chromosome partitioning protein
LAASNDELESEALHERLDEIDRQLATFVGFDQTQKRLAGCFVSIGHDGTPFVDKGLVKPEQRKAIAALLGEDEAAVKSAKPRKMGGLPESLRRDLAAQRLQVAQVEIASHPTLALELLVFQATSQVIGKRRVTDGAEVEFSRPRANPNGEQEPTAAIRALAAIEKSLPTDWLNGTSEADRFEAFRSLPEAAKLELLAYVVALSLKPKLAPAESGGVTGYDAILSATAGDVAAYWRPTKDDFLSRINRNQLLAIGRDVLGEAWAQSRFAEKKSVLVDQLDRAFADPDKSGRTAEQAEKLTRWLPHGMSFDIAAAPKPSGSSVATQAA